MDKVKRFKEIVNELADLYEKKNKNYGDSFGQLYRDLGPISGLVPLHNKLDRITNLVKGDSNHFESIEDNLRDLANYAIMNLIEMEDNKVRTTLDNWHNWEEDRVKQKTDDLVLRQYKTPAGWVTIDSSYPMNSKFINKAELYYGKPVADEESMKAFNEELKNNIDKIVASLDDDMAEYSNEH